MILFSYGSNMLADRLRRRTPSAERVARALLPGHCLRFHKRGGDGSGKCDAERSPRAQDVVHGILVRVAREELSHLHEAEGPGYGFEEVRVAVEGRTLSVPAYLAQATHVEPDLRPFNWYRKLVLAGAIQNGLPEDYVEAIRCVESVPDPDHERAARNAEILRSPGWDC